MGLSPRIKKTIKLECSERNLLIALGALVILVSIPLTVSLSRQRPSLTPQAAAQTINLEISAGADDAYQSYSSKGSADYNDYYISMNSNDANLLRYSGGFRFTNVNIPKGSVVNSAVFQPYVYNSTNDNPNVDIFANDVDNAKDFVIERDVVNRVRTSNSVAWVATNVGVGYKSSPDIKNVIQGVVNRPGWSAGNAIVLLIHGKTSPDRLFYARSYEYVTGGRTPARLIITYTPPPPLCSDECSPSGAKQCTDGTHYKTCGNYDTDSCLEWSSSTSCPAGQTCSGSGVCSAPPNPTPKPPGPGSSPGAKILESIQLEISIPNLRGKVQVKVEVGSVSQNIQVQGSGPKSYSLDLKAVALPLGQEYILVLQSGKSLVKKVRFTPEGSESKLTIGDLILGDINQDNYIGLVDQLALASFVASQTSFGDLNGDGITNSFDWAILLTHFGKKGD
ncbi:MAG: hypothetical protein A2126_00575 [Candidatus Woykebacteria bacterium GWB1_45_5]|uniref:Dockerin domain-containing protein n=2 Tax=Candidatus Woykeibacteriota TaxID=1817899 RepID=A0A1G1W3A7_9BACT|nr:MAG: hypothetical protein A2113_03500 [Candidatus Woykebacteria bacterium GWA1_44_8]OGY24609.1 MAG: hypothetical protein A2126_00575 [Candidatus Woykebacteria bacterium GWB1_45_5]